ncbi:hypothetical protein DPMN_010460 [Dreissena polymorpha]|uniref:Uncharacterized protein n=1 Tax=Dreissena polymorpha TaxID=45954 RepID=A0A9D4N493_DREPO|nr:hypothetical protein DPMN_010460 [Dreissena polymorpha]
MVPTCQWTMAQEGDKQVRIAGKDDKRQITVLLSCTKAGKILLPLKLFTKAKPVDATQTQNSHQHGISPTRKRIGAMRRPWTVSWTTLSCSTSLRYST